MKKINLKGIVNTLSEKEMKNVKGGNDEECAKNKCGGDYPLQCCYPQWEICSYGYCKLR